GTHFEPLLLEQRREVARAPVERRELLVVGLGDVDAVALAQLHDDVQEVHRVQLDLLAQADVGLQVRQGLVGRDGAGDGLDGGEDLFAIHSGGIRGADPSVKRRTTSAELMPSIPKERFRMFPMRPSSLGRFATRLRTSQAGSRWSTLIVGWTQPS